MFSCGLLAQNQPAAPPAPAASQTAPAAAPTATAAPAATATPAAESPVPSAEQSFSGFVDLGYRWVTGVGGNQDTYRSVIDLASGLRLLSTEFTILDPKKHWFDRIDVRLQLGRSLCNPSR